MCADIVLGCSNAGNTVAVRLMEPELFDPPKAGALLPAPAAWARETRLFGDTKALSDWVRECVGDALLDAIGTLVTADETPSRLFIYGAADVLDECHSIPWELLEHWGVEHRHEVGENLTVVRLAAIDGETRPPSAIGERLRILMTWADPDRDIPGLDGHIRDLERFAAENDYRVQLKVVELRDPEGLAGELGRFRPDVVYHLGHGHQPAPAGAVTLRIGARKARADLELGAFMTMLECLGPPRLVVLNACESFRGSDVNAYLSAAVAGARSPHVDAVVAMQTKVPTRAAIGFAGSFFARLANGAGLAASFRDARRAMRRGASKQDNLPRLTRFIPVLFQRTREDKLFSADLVSRNRSRVLAKLRYHLVVAVPRLRRDVDGLIAEFLSGRDARRVAVVRGPRWTGKSLAVSTILAALLEETRGALYLYSDTQPAELAGAVDGQILQVLRAFASRYDWMTGELREALEGRDFRDAAEAVAVLASWLRDQENAGLRVAVVLDSLPDALASQLAELAARVIRQGRLMIVCRNAEVRPEWAVAAIDIDRMTAPELARALPQKPAEEIEDLIARSNGMPLFVVAALESRLDAARAAELVAAATAGLDDDTIALLRVCALSEEPVPYEVFAAMEAEDLVASLPGTLTGVTAANARFVPQQLKNAVLEGIAPEDEVALRGDLVEAFRDVAEEERTERFHRERAVACYKEALRQSIRLLSLSDDDPPEAKKSSLAATDVMERLHEQLLERDHQPETARHYWAMYYAALARAGFEPGRSADARYARALAAAGMVEEADDLLDAVTRSGKDDALQLQALLVRSDITKDLGLADGWKQRVELLERARAVAAKLESGDDDSRRRLAEIEFKLGNTLGYGRNADWKKAVDHVGRAAAIYDDLADIRAYRALSEIVEIRRYNGQLSDSERLQALDSVRTRAEELALLGERYDAIEHLYELGRLEESPAAKAIWFRRAFERAGTSYAPINWHAAIRWRMNEVEAGQTAFAEAASELERYANELAKWQQRAWSRRVLRETLHFFARRFGEAGETEKQRDALRRCWEVVRNIHRKGEGRRDETERVAIACDLAAHGLMIDDELLQRSLAPGLGEQGGMP